MDRELLLEKIIEADGNEIDLPVENERIKETFETLMELQEDGIIKLGQYFDQGNSINLKARFLSDTLETQSSIGKKVFERTKKSISEALDEMQDEIDRLNNKITELEKQLAER